VALNFPDSPTVGQIYTDTTSGFSYEWTGSLWKSYSAASASTIKALDDISASFNGTTQTFALTSSGSAVYPVNDQQIIINLGGVIQDSVNDFNISGSNITFTTAPAAGLTFSGTLLGVGVPIDYANSGNVQQRQSYTATAGQTSFTFTPGYNPGYLDVYRNGVRLLSGSDYTATSGTGFALTVPAQLNDEIEAIGYKVASLVDATGNFINLKATGISTLATTFIDANLSVGVGYSVGIGTNNPPYHLTVTEVGASPTPALSYCIADFTNNINGYSQVNIRNASTAANASGDLVITTDNGTDTTNYIDLGINNSSFSNGSWTINGALDGYLYSSNQNFSIGVAFPDRYLSFFAGGTLAADEKMRVTDNGVGIGTTVVTTALTVVGVVSATSFVGSLTGNATSATNAQGLTGTPNITVGNVTGSAATFTNLTVNGTQTIINTTTLDITDKTVGIGSTSTPSDVLADGAGIVVYGTTNKTLFYDNTRKGWDFNIPLTTDEVRFYNVAEKLTRIDGNTVNLVYSANGSNIGLATNPTGDITLNVTGIPTDSSFDNHVITFSVFVTNAGTARTVTAINLNGFSETINWSGGSLAAAISGVTTSTGIDIYSFTGINTVGSASTTANYRVLGVVNGGYR